MANSAGVGLPSLSSGDTVRQFLAVNSQILKVAGVETSDNDARLLLAQACQVNLHELDKALLMGQSLGDLALVGQNHAGSKVETGLTQEVALATLREFVRRRARREPLQYIVGHAPFRFLDLEVGPGVFIPRPETEIVVQAGLDWLLGEGSRGPKGPVVVDMCAGSGAIGLALATEVAGLRVWAVEISEDAAVWTRRNFERYQHEIDRQKSSYRLVIGDATDSETLADLDGQVDLIVTNPPYVPQSLVLTQPEVTHHDPPRALYGGSPDGLLIPERIVARAASLLRTGGYFVMEHDPSQAEVLRQSVESWGFTDVTTGVDLTGRPRFLNGIR
ncbi:protein-(glutamine-N5) methyltransferase, release factor-specific [Bifidobacterium xylocopae]|uniref:Release factor glutamine methyltransferase n=2 Tax=Bifidobacterium xylocopae TaxID=2493119 RepID=A0A366KDT0_9BIFI|nr:protein-(glutamine-N5) methyltransferase, release factor-specific [Bifidobacterium xylocopae]